MKINTEVKKVVKQLKNAQAQFHTAMKDKGILEEARKYAEKQKGELKKLLSSDITKVKKFIELEKKNLEKIQKDLPAEIQRLSKFVNAQKKEFEGLLKSLTSKGKKKVRRAALGRGKKKKSTPNTGTTAAHASSGTDAASSTQEA